MRWARTLLFTLLYPGTVCVLAPAATLWLFDRGARTVLDTFGWLGVALLAGGTLVYVWCAWDFGARGRGAPAPYDPPRMLVVSGLHRFTRNPMYVGVVAILIGQALLLRSLALLVLAVLAAAGFHLRVVLYEEPALRRLFGDALTCYAAATPRWFGPRRPPAN